MPLLVWEVPYYPTYYFPVADVRLELLHETGLPVRYYVPKTHVHMELMERGELVTHCPYKGSAESWGVRAGGRLHENMAWSYAAPLAESQKIAGLMAFYNEKVDLFIDGVRQQRPKTHFS